MFKDVNYKTYTDKIKEIIKPLSKDINKHNYIYEINTILGKIKDSDENSKYFFLPLALAFIKFKMTFNQDLRSKVLNKISEFFITQPEPSDEIVNIDMALAQIKAAISSMIVGRKGQYDNINNAVINAFIDLLNSEDKKAFEDFWGFRFAEGQSHIQSVGYTSSSKGVQPPTIKELNAKIFAKMTSNQTVEALEKPSSMSMSENNSKELEKAVSNVSEATKKLLGALSQVSPRI